MMRDIIENTANELRAKVRRDYQSGSITSERFQEMMQFIEEIEYEGDDLSVIKMLHVAKMTYIIMK
jgi:hypothetical protein